MVLPDLVGILREARQVNSKYALAAFGVIAVIAIVIFFLNKLGSVTLDASQTLLLIGMLLLTLIILVIFGPRENQARLSNDTDLLNEKHDDDIGFPAILVFEGITDPIDSPNFYYNDNGTWQIFGTGHRNTESIDHGYMRLNRLNEGSGAWIWKLPSNVSTGNSIKMEIIDDDNQAWIVNEIPQIPSVNLLAKKKRGTEK